MKKVMEEMVNEILNVPLILILNGVKLIGPETYTTVLTFFNDWDGLKGQLVSFFIYLVIAAGILLPSKSNNKEN